MNNLGLAVEAAKNLIKADGVELSSRNVGGIKITDVILRESAAKKIGKLSGRYITLEGEADLPQMPLLLGKALGELISEKRRIFAAGLGNPDVTHDSLGAITVRRIIPRNNKKYLISAIETDVAARTGLDTAKLVRGAARELRAECVIAIDAMACENPERIGKNVQLCDTGIILGLGAGKNCGEISQKYLGIPTVVVGVPTMTALSSLTKNTAGNYLVTTADIDVVVGQWAEAIAEAINGLLL